MPVSHGSTRWTLSPKEAKEWATIRALAKRNHIAVKRVGPANVTWSDGVYAQLGTGHALEIMRAKVTVKKARAGRAGR